MERRVRVRVSTVERGKGRGGELVKVRSRNRGSVVYGRR